MNFIKTVFASMFGFFLAGVVLFIFFILFIVAIVSSATKGETVVVKDASVLKLKLSGSIAEKGDKAMEFETGLPFLDDLSKVGLYDIRECLQAAAKDDKIKGILLEPGFVDAGWATMEALRKDLEAFKASGKFIYAYSEFYTEKTWYLASVADEAWIQPFGGVEFNGLVSNPAFLKGLMEKIGVKPKVFRVGTFKSAVEPFIESKMSDANREQTQVLLDDIWNHFLENSAKSKKSSSESLDAIAEKNGISMAKDAVDAGLLTGTCYYNEMLDKMKEKTGKEKTKDLNFLSLKEYMKVVSTKEKKGDFDKTVAVVFASGEIVDGKGESDNIGGDKLAEELRKLREDDKVKAVVLRVNSPGGSGLASDIIHKEMQLLKKAKPTVVSMGDVAASGGYYISAPADKIFAEANTITGSIGVFGLMMNTEKLFNEKLGVTFDRVTTNPFADIGNPNREMRPEEEAYIQGAVNHFYGRFIHVVMEGRGFADSLTVDKIAQGRVWSGTRAKEIKLVDEIGGLEDAIRFAATKANLGEGYKVRPYTLEDDPFEKILKSFGAASMQQSEQMKMVQPFEKEWKLLKQFRDMMSHTGVLARMPMDLQID